MKGIIEKIKKNKKKLTFNFLKTSKIKVSQDFSEYTNLIKFQN